VQVFVNKKIQGPINPIINQNSMYSLHMTIFFLISCWDMNGLMRYISVYSYKLNTHKYCCWSHRLKFAVRYIGNTILIIIFMDCTMFCLFHPLEEHVHPSILNVGALYFIALLGCMLKFSLEFIFHL
jgi:hypothetical protein